ncbi:hypothetical protein DFH09DRAFT_1067566 [Mycena vulgaris]|nr:hypothetical protein DFH09DRAFT_1067566 [Mycena vulgaris]
MSRRSKGTNPYCCTGRRALCIDIVKLPKQSRILDVRVQQLYSILLLYARSVWPDKTIVSDGGAQTGVILSSKVKPFGNVLVRGIKYGMATHHRRKSYCYGFIEGRIPCQINYLLKISLSSGEEKLVALVKRSEPLYEDITREAVKSLPWAADLKISVWNHGGMGSLKAVAMKGLSGRFARGEIILSEPSQMLWVVFSLDHTGQEPEPFDDED